jgi:hypothetical protein
VLFEWLPLFDTFDAKGAGDDSFVVFRERGGFGELSRTLVGDSGPNRRRSGVPGASMEAKKINKKCETRDVMSVDLN